MHSRKRSCLCLSLPCGQGSLAGSALLQLALHSVTPCSLLSQVLQLLQPQPSPTAAHSRLCCLQIGALLRNGIGALTFGTKLPDGKLAYATGPTWMLYSGDELEACEDSVPVLIRRWAAHLVPWLCVHACSLSQAG